MEGFGLGNWCRVEGGGLTVGGLRSRNYEGTMLVPIQNCAR